MIGDIDLKEIDSRIQSMKKEAEELKAIGDAFPALSKNVSRILANIKMLEINISDVLDTGERSREQSGKTRDSNGPHGNHPVIKDFDRKCV